MNSLRARLFSIAGLMSIFAGNVEPQTFKQFYHPKRNPQPRRPTGAVHNVTRGPNNKRRAKHAWMRANNASGRQWVKFRKAQQRAARRAAQEVNT